MGIPGLGMGMITASRQRSGKVREDQIRRNRSRKKPSPGWLQLAKQKIRNGEGKGVRIVKGNGGVCLVWSGRGMVEEETSRVGDLSRGRKSGGRGKKKKSEP